MTLGRSSLLALTVVAGMAAGASAASADGPGKGAEWPNLPWHTWSGLYGGVHLGSLDTGWDDGAVGGIQIGKNWQSGKIVYGLEADLSVSGVDGVDWVGTVRGRLGYLLSPGLLVYGTAGLGVIDWDHGGSDSEFVAGIGVEGKLTDTTTLRVEYLNFNDSDVDVVRVGVNWKLNW